MSYSRFQQMLQSVPANARKLYDIIPIAEGWSYSQIHQEAQRRGLNMRSEVIMGAVGELKDAGLVQTADNLHRRTPHKPRPEPIITNKEATLAGSTDIKPIQTRPEDRLSPFDKIAALATHLRKLADDASAIADDLDDVALAIEESAGGEAAAKAELARIRQVFKTLMPEG